MFTKLREVWLCCRLEGMKRSSHGLKLKIQIDVNCGSCECQFKGISVKGESPTVLLSREANEAMAEKDKKKDSERE